MKIRYLFLASTLLFSAAISHSAHAADAEIHLHKGAITKKHSDDYSLDDIEKEQSRGTTSDGDLRSNQLCYEGKVDDVKDIIDAISDNKPKAKIHDFQVGSDQTIHLLWGWKGKDAGFNTDIPACR